jgi:RNA polymerase sigma-70 factor, ECF subfamily
MDEDERRELAVYATAYEKTPSPPPEALEAIFREHHGAVYRAAYRITGNPMDAEDVLQIVFTRLLRRDEQPDLSAGAGGYLHRAAVNAALDVVRSQRRARAVDIGEVADHLIDDASGPDDRRQSRELGRRLRAALARLPPRQAEIFALRYLEGLGNLEISRLLGSSQTVIAVTLHRARHRLQKELGAPEGELS